MKRNFFKKTIFVLAIMAILITIMVINSYAATSISISTSKSSVSPGGTFTVTVSAVGAGPVTTSVSNGSGGKTEFLDNSSYSFTCTAGSSGTVTINASGTLGDYATGNEANRSASRTVQIVQPTSNGNNSSGGSSTSSGVASNKNTSTKKEEEKEKSKDSTLSALTVKEGAITPEFNKDVKAYSLTIPYETSEVNVTATPIDSKATVTVEGNKELKEGENTVVVKVTAEDGSTSNYIIKVTRKRVPVALKSLTIKYENENGELIELPLNPVFGFDKLEYTLEDLEYWVEKLNIEALPNIEGATVDIQGAESLQTGENVITINVKIVAEDQSDVKEGEEPKEEVITYTIKVNKKEEPTLIAKISNWFKSTGTTISSWYNQNTQKIILASLGFCVVALIGLSVYIVIDYNKYKDVIAKVKKVKDISESENIIEQIHQNSNEIKENNVEQINKDNRPKGGKHF